MSYIHEGIIAGYKYYTSMSFTNLISFKTLKKKMTKNEITRFNEPFASPVEPPPSVCSKFTMLM